MRLCLLLGLVPAQQCQQSARINTDKQPHKHDNNGTDPADAHGKSTTHTTSVLDILAFPIAYPTHRNTSGRILPMGKHNSTSLGPHSERRGRPSRSMRSHIGGAAIYRKQPPQFLQKLARLPHPELPESTVPSRFRGKPEADQPRKAAQSTIGGTASCSG
jgi:hypothetical protein